MHTATPNFRFQRFTVWHDHCAMRVGTDGVLIGAWAPLPDIPSVRILDIGTGSGLIALMLAQRCEQAGKTFHIQAIDIDPNATAQAMSNFQLSPWAEHLQATTYRYKPAHRRHLFILLSATRRSSITVCATPMQPEPRHGTPTHSPTPNSYTTLPHYSNHKGHSHLSYPPIPKIPSAV